MSRPITAGMLGAIQASQVLPAIFVQATMASGTVYLWSGPGSVVWNGQNWQGVGSLLNISTVEEKAEVRATGISITLSGIDSPLLTDVLGGSSFGAFSAPGTLIANPITVWSAKAASSK